MPHMKKSMLIKEARKTGKGSNVLFYRLHDS